MITYLIDFWKEYWPVAPLIVAYFFIESRLTPIWRETFPKLALLVAILALIICIYIDFDKVNPLFTTIMIVNISNLYRDMKKKKAGNPTTADPGEDE
jgi:Na+/proline symporter